MTRLEQSSCLAATAAATILASAQTVSAQAVQLPTISQFSVGTTVSVPVGGRAHLGSVRRARESRVSRGVGLGAPLFGNRGIGREMSIGGVDVGVQIHDMAELDRQTLAAARKSPRAIDPAEVQRLRMAMWLSQNMGRAAPINDSSQVPMMQATSRPRATEQRPLRLGASRGFAPR